MSEQEESNDILVVHQNRVIFSSGKGLLTEHSKISAQVTQVLNLFTQKIMGGEQIHFIRFENHRMIFLFSQDRKNVDLAAIVLIPIEKSARQVIPAMSIVLRMLEEFLQGNILDTQNRQLDCFYQILSAPEKSPIFVPRTASGILTALILLTAFAHDMRYGINQIVSNLHIVDPDDPLTLQLIFDNARKSRVLSFLPISEELDDDNILTIGQKTPLRQYFSALPDEDIYEVISRIFGIQSNANKMKKFLSNDEAKEIAQSIALLPKDEDSFIRNNILLPTVLQPGKDVIVTMSTPLMNRLKELSSSPDDQAIEPVEGITIEPSYTEKMELENIAMKLQEGTSQTKDSQTLESADVTIKSETALRESQILSAEPDALPVKPQTIKPKTPPISPRLGISDDLIRLLNEKRKRGFVYQFEQIPIMLDIAPFAMNLRDNLGIPFDDSKITVRLYFGDENSFLIHIYTNSIRLPALKESLEDLSIRIGGETFLREDYVSLEGSLKNRESAIRALMWLCVVEYLTQVEMKLHDLSPRFQIPNEGSILIIPPKRDFVREKIPSKFVDFIDEKDIRSKIEKEALWTLGKAEDEILSRLMKPLKRGEGVVFIASDNNQEMEEVALFLLLISETCGIGFSRW